MSHVVKDTGACEERKLRELAKATYLEKHKSESTQDLNMKRNAEMMNLVDGIPPRKGRTNEGFKSDETREEKATAKEGLQQNLAEIPQIIIESETSCDTFF